MLVQPEGDGQNVSDTVICVGQIFPTQLNCQREDCIINKINKTMVSSDLLSVQIPQLLMRNFTACLLIGSIIISNKSFERE